MSLFHRLIRWLTGRFAGYDCLRLEILMDYSEPIREWGRPDSFGSAAIRWIRIDDDLLSTSERYNFFRTILVALHYAKILSAHNETRSELFTRTEVAVEKCMLSEGKTSVDFTPWDLHIRDPVGIAGDSTISIWPWKIVEPETIDAMRSFAAVGYPKTYVETLKVGSKSRLAPSGFWSYLDMPIGGERLLAPASVLLAIKTLSLELVEQDRQSLAILLWHVNRYYGSPDRISLASEAKAVTAAMETILSAGKTSAK